MIRYFYSYMGKFCFLVMMILACECLFAQDSVTRQPVDTQQRMVNNVPRQPRPYRPVTIVPRRNFILPDSIPVFQNNDTLVYANHPFFRFRDPVRYSITIKKWEGKEAIFYSIIALLLLFALIKNGFNRYITDLFKIFFRTTVKQRQIKEQLVQSPLPSLLLNIFFLLSGGMFLTLLLRYFNLGLNYNFWILFIYCVMALICIYGLKYISLKLLGWIFQVSEAIDAYIFVVFTTNKVIGMALVPLVVILAFTSGVVNQSAMSLSIMIVIGLFIYRFYLSYSSLHRLVHIGFFHFLLYLCAFEIAPLLLINKLLFRFLGETS